MKIYVYYLYGEKSEITEENYPGIEGSEITSDSNYCYALYAWTHNKNIRKLFKNQRNMNLYKEVIHDISKDDFDKFSDEYADTFLEERPITTKGVNGNDRIIATTAYVLSTNKELNYLVYNSLSIMQKQLKPLVKYNIYIQERYFSGIYRNALKLFNFDDIMDYVFPMEDSGIPFKIVDEDTLAIYSHLYHNTYRKDLEKL